MNKLNINIILCEKIDKESNSFINIFDKMKYNSEPMNFQVVLITNSIGLVKKKLKILMFKHLEGKKSRATSISEVIIEQEEKAIQEETYVFVVQDIILEKGKYQIRVYSTDLENNELEISEVVKQGNLEAITKFKVE